MSTSERVCGRGKCHDINVPHSHVNRKRPSDHEIYLCLTRYELPQLFGVCGGFGGSCFGWVGVCESRLSPLQL